MRPQVTIKHEFPPNIEAIRKRFPLTGNEIFAYDKVIYHPGGGHLTAPLIAHETIHFQQQGDDPDGWWKRYIIDDAFRYKQELEAHREEFRIFCKLHRRKDFQWKYLDRLVRRLRSPVYGTSRYSHWQVLQQLKEGIMR